MNESWFSFFAEDINSYLDRHIDNLSVEQFDLVILSKVLNNNMGLEKDIIQKAHSLLTERGYLYLRFNGMGYENLSTYDRAVYTLDSIKDWTYGYNILLNPVTLHIQKSEAIVEEYILICHK